MDHLYNEDQLAIQKMVREFVKKEVAPIVDQLDEGHEMPQDLYHKICEMGLQCPSCPEEYGGPNLDAVTTAIIAEEFGRADKGIYGYVSANSLAGYVVLAAGTDKQKKTFFDNINAGGLASFALTEPNAGSDAASIRTKAVREGDEYVLNGTKCFITNSSYAKLFVVLATVDSAKGAKGVTAFLVERDRPGLSIGKVEEKMGVRSSNTAEVVLEGVRIPVENRLGEEGKAFAYALNSLTIGRITVAAESVGLAQEALNQAVKYSKERMQFGKSISKFQGIQFMLADMEIKIEAARALVHAAAVKQDMGLDVTREAAVAKCYATDIAMEVAIDAAQVFGGYGYMREYPMEKMIRDAKIGQVVEGTNQVQRVVISKSLLK